MNTKTTTNSNTNIGLGGFIFLIFLTLKLLNYIDWSWWWVLSPMIVSFNVYVVLGVWKDRNNWLVKKDL